MSVGASVSRATHAKLLRQDVDDDVLDEASDDEEVRDVEIKVHLGVVSLCGLYAIRGDSRSM